MSKITPVLVVGMNRSGTKWLTNSIGAHPRVAVLQTERGGGAKDTNAFGGFQHRFDLRRPDEYIAFIEMWANTDEFRAAGVDKRVFYDSKPWPTSVTALFRRLMEEHCRAAGADYWVQKLGPLQGWAFRADFPDAHVIVIRRDVVSVARSSAQLAHNHGRPVPSPEALAADYVRMDAWLKALARARPVLEVTYEALKDETEGTLRRICAHLGLEYDPEMARPRFAANTSFRNGAPRHRIFSPTDERRIRQVRALLSRVPPAWIRSAERVGRTLRPWRPQLVPGTFGSIKQDLDL